MKAILEFKLPEETDEHTDAINGTKWRAVMQEFDNYLRGKIKYGSEGMSEEQLAVYEEVRRELHNYTSDMNLEIH